MLIDYNNNLINKAMTLYFLRFDLKIFNACFNETNTINYAFATKLLIIISQGANAKED